MNSYYLVKLKSTKFVSGYDIGIKIPPKYAAEIEDILKDRPHETVPVYGNANFDLQGEISYLYNLLSQEKNMYSHTWHSMTTLEKHYCAKASSPVMPKECMERVLKYAKSQKFINVTSDKLYYKFDNKTILLITKKEVIEFRTAYDWAARQIDNINKLIERLNNFALIHDFKLKGDEHLLVDGEYVEVDERQENPQSDEFSNKSYIDLE